MNTERDKYLTEAIGEYDPVWGCAVEPEIYDITCVHDKDYVGYWKVLEDSIIDFSKWEGFGKLWEWAQKQEWWLMFGRRFMTSQVIVQGHEHYCPNFKSIHPDRFADALYEFLRGR